MASIEERSDNWRIYWRAGGRAGRKQSVTLPSDKLALVAKALVEERGHKVTAEEVYTAVLGLNRDDVEVYSPTVTEWVDTWLAEKRDISEDTHAEYAWLLRSRVSPKPFGGLRVSDVDRDAVKRLMVKAVDDGLKPASVRKLHVVLHQLFRDAIPRHRLDNPCTKPPGQRSNGLPKVKRYPAVYLTPAEADLIVANCADEIRDLVRVAFGTGLRLAELLALRVEDVDLAGDAPAIFVRQARKKSGKVGDPKSESSERTVTISKTLVAVLRPLVEGKFGHLLVFRSPNGKMWQPANLRNRYWKRAVAAAQRCPDHMPADFKVKPRRGPVRTNWLAVSTCDCPSRLHKTPRIHDTRHTHVDWLLDARWELTDIQIRIGHDSVKTTFDMYGNRRRRGSASQLDALDAMLTRVEVAAEPALVG